MNSLVAPADKPNGPTPIVDITPLTLEETKSAVAENMNTDYITKYPKIERMYADPIYNNQVFSLHSFVPAKGATPDKDGVYGMIKFRGAFPTKEEAEHRSAELIRTVDSFHKIYISYVGRPVPATVSSAYSEKTTEIDIRKKAIEVVSDEIRAKKETERQDIIDMKKREEELLADVSTETPPEEKYTTLQVKRAQLIWTYKETAGKLAEMRDIIQRTRQEIDEMDKTDPRYRKIYVEKYMEARKKSGLPADDQSFMKYLDNDPVLEEYTIVPKPELE
jgi:hypothetical protein